MRWMEPAMGTERVRKRFAWWPVRAHGEKTTYWLERVFIYEEYIGSDVWYTRRIAPVKP